MLKMYILFTLLVASTCFVQAYEEFIDPNPSNGNGFGDNVVVLANGNVVITSPYSDINGITNCGAVYLYNGKSGKLISSLYGNSVQDCIGSPGVIGLQNSNFIVLSSNWGNTKGAITWANGVSGLNGFVSISNSLVGSKEGDLLGSNYLRKSIIILKNGNILLRSPRWNNKKGAVTWVNAQIGICGEIDENNSLIGSEYNQEVGKDEIVLLTNGNYVVSTPGWSGSKGAVTWGDASKGVCGVINELNSLVGTHNDDFVGGNVGDSIGVKSLSNGNYVILSPNWNNGVGGGAFGGYVGAVTWADGNIGIKGQIDSNNSLLGTCRSDKYGCYFDNLPNGNFVVGSFLADVDGVEDAGVITFVNGEFGLTGYANKSNSLVGEHVNDNLGSGGIVALENGNYLVNSPHWSNDTVKSVGAVTFVDAKSPIIGYVNISNSLIGSNENDIVGSSGIVTLKNSKYIVLSNQWNNNKGAVTWIDGNKGIVGIVSSDNSLLGTGNSRIHPLTNGDYIVQMRFNDKKIAFTLGSNLSGITGIISEHNSLIDTMFASYYWSVEPLESGNAVLYNSRWDHGKGAVRIANCKEQFHGYISNDNAIVGFNKGDCISSGGVYLLKNGNFVINSPNWDHGKGAVTLASEKSISSINSISVANSIVGSQDQDSIGYLSSPINYPNFPVVSLNDGNYLVSSPYWNHSKGAITLCNGEIPTCGIVDSNNSIVGSSMYDYVGENIDNKKSIYELSNGNIIIAAQNWQNQRGAVVFCKKGLFSTGSVGSINSLKGPIGDSDFQLRPIVLNDVNKEFYVVFSGYYTATCKVYRCSYEGIDLPLSINDGIEKINTEANVFPNPVSNNANLKIYLKHDCNVSAQVFDMSGKFLIELFNQFLYSGNNELNIDFSRIPDGVYQLIINQGGEVQSYPFTVVK